MAFGIDRYSMHMDSYNHGSLSNGGLNLDLSYFDTGDTLRNYAYARINFSCVADNTFRNLIVGNDFKGTIEIQGSDASSTDYGRWQFRLTSPAYGVNSYTNEAYLDGGWNTGTFAIQRTTSGSANVIQFRYSSYYSSSNTGYFEMIFRSMY